MQHYSADDFLIKILGQPTFKNPNIKTGFVHDADRIVFPLHTKDIQSYNERNEPAPTMELGGPKQQIFFDPTKTKLGIVTCGGLCPGLNTIIRSVVFTATQSYGVSQVLGFRNGYYGLNPASGLKPMELTQDLVDTIHETGGTILSSSRGPQDPKIMVDYLKSLGVNILIVVGGDGTMRGALDIAREAERRQVKLSVIGVPKTIDNDIVLIERSFGFETAVEEASKVIRSAHVESKGAPNGIGLVKLMGRESGFIAAAATLASAVVNFCLIPESKFQLTGEKGLLRALEKRIKTRGHAVIVAAEGAGQDLFKKDGEGFDASGNRRLQDIGPFLKEQINAYFKSIKTEINVKYIDPSYLVRSVPATGDDNVYCLMLGQNAVHAGLSGRTEMVVGYRNDHYVHLPMPLIASGRKTIDPAGRIWKTVLDTTRQPEEML